MTFASGARRNPARLAKRAPRRLLLVPMKVGLATRTAFFLGFALATVTGVHAQSTPHSTALVTADNFVRAETDVYFGQVVKRGGFGKFNHHRELTRIDRQTVNRMNRDKLY
jgi:hypothetical protein